MQTLKGADSVPAGEACGCPERPGAGSGVGSLLRPPPGKPPPLTQPFPHQKGDADILPACLPAFWVSLSSNPKLRGMGREVLFTEPLISLH